MKKLLLLLFFISNVAGFSQTGDSVKKVKQLKRLISADSVAKKIQDLKYKMDTAIQISDSNQVSESISRNFDGILQWQKQQKAKEKRSAWIRICFGIILLGILVVGMRRRKK